MAEMPPDLDIDHLARIASRATRWASRPGAQDRYEAIWHAIAEQVVRAGTTPSLEDLVATGLRAADAHVRDEMHHHGRSGRHAGEPFPGFDRYWGAIPGASPEDAVVEPLALTQIWPSLTPAERKALAALAKYGDYKLAAEACGLTLGRFTTNVSRGRRHFLALWHQGETPSRTWRVDRRSGPRSGHDRYGRRRITESELDAIRERYYAGELQAALAAESGITPSTLSALLTGRSRPAPDPVAGAAQ